MNESRAAGNDPVPVPPPRWFPPHPPRHHGWRQVFLELYSAVGSPNVNRVEEIVLEYAGSEIGLYNAMCEKYGIQPHFNGMFVRSGWDRLIAVDACRRSLDELVTPEMQAKRRSAAKAWLAEWESISITSFARRPQRRPLELVDALRHSCLGHAYTHGPTYGLGHSELAPRYLKDFPFENSRWMHRRPARDHDLPAVRAAVVGPPVVCREYPWPRPKGQRPYSCPTRKQVP